ncbi:MAG TPA: biopolymer transporter ExbD [Candidatus Sulfotelmatobacter sp.]|nr:biopolymer transporter ExbD [Candidatus Sulfotelmatobacter sp.]
MKKCSHSAHHSLTELNITPLLDLAFVLLVIFIITTLPPVTDAELKLPTATKRLKDQPPKANYISIQADGTLYLNKAKFTSPADMLQELINLRTADPDLNLIVRGDGHVQYKDVRAVLDVCQQAAVPKVDLATEPLNSPAGSAN